jgi:2-dehydro-3-deoxyphosphogluconate aldolase/(4S)-4-hydroxy-2-oxoglutarate aldolase
MKWFASWRERGRGSSDKDMALKVPMTQEMTKLEIRRRILDVKIVPVVRAATPEQAITASQAIWKGGIPIVEITMTVPNAIDVIRQLAGSSQMLVGAGTVLDAGQARECIEAGAQFIVSPGFDPDTVRFVTGSGILMMAGALTPTEVIAVWKAGADFAKIFPCGNMGGASYIKALKAALPQVAMVPTGGVSLSTAAQFLDAGASALGVGGELVSSTALDAGDVSRITELARQFMAAVKGSNR